MDDILKTKLEEMSKRDMNIQEKLKEKGLYEYPECSSPKINSIGWRLYKLIRG